MLQLYCAWALLLQDLCLLSAPEDHLLNPSCFWCHSGSQWAIKEKTYIPLDVHLGPWYDFASVNEIDMCSYNETQTYITNLQDQYSFPYRQWVGHSLPED